MHRIVPIPALIWIAAAANPAPAQITVTGARVDPACPPGRRAADRGANVVSPRRERNRYFAARPIYPPVPRGTRASITFEPYTSKYYPTADEYYPPTPASPLLRGR